MELRNLISILFSLTLLTQCGNKRSDRSKIDIKFDLNPISASTSIHPTSYIGEWNYGFPFYSSELLINKEGTFKFHEQGCMGHGYSEGKWINYGTDILLISFEQYSTNKASKPMEVKSLTNPSRPMKKKKQDETKYTLDTSFFNVSVSYKFGQGDTSNVYFDKVQLRLQGDTLYQLDKEGLRTSTKYILIKNIY